MFFNIYEKNESNFDHNQFILTQVTAATLTEEINGIFNLDMECLIQDSNSSMLVIGNVIKALTPDDRPAQLFRITNVSKDLTKINVTAMAIAIADLSANFIPDSNVVNMNRVQGVNHLLEATLQKHRFKAVGKGNAGALNNLRVVRYNPIQAVLGSEDNTMLSRFGGEYQFDNFNIIAADFIGTDNGVIIAHKKNIIGIEETINDDDLVTRIIPQGTNELLLPEYYIDSPKINNYEKVYHRKINFDIGVQEADEEGNGEVVTQEQAYNMLRAAARGLFENDHIDDLFFNYKINFIELSKTEEYKDYAILEKVNLGDTVKVLVKKSGLTLTGRVYKYTFDLLKNRYDVIEIGSKKPDISSVINSTNQQISSIKNMIELEVSSMNENLNSKLTITEQGIMSEVNNKTQGLQSQIQQQAGAISSKVSRNEVSTIIQQSPESVKIAFNQGSNYIDFSSAGIKAFHGDGGYSYMGSGGFIYKKNGNDRPYKFINYTVKISQVPNGQWTSIYLPSDFQGKNINSDFTIVAWAGDVDSSVNAAKQKDGIRRLFIEIGSWDSNSRKLLLRPKLQKVGVMTGTMWGWDSSTTTSGNTIGEGAVDIIVLAQM